MTNILPVDAQKKVWRMYRSRFVIALAIVSLILSAVATLALVPSYLVVLIAAPPVTEVSILQDAVVVDYTAVLARAQGLVQALLPMVNSTTSPSEIITSALIHRPQGVMIEHVSYVSGKTGQITIAGSGNRDSISEYRDILSKNSYFTSVSVPVGALVSQEGRFTISLSGNF